MSKNCRCICQTIQSLILPDDDTEFPSTERMRCSSDRYQNKNMYSYLHAHGMPVQWLVCADDVCTLVAALT